MSYVKAFKSYRLTDILTDRKVMRGHFRSCDENDGHTTGSTIPENPWNTQTSWLYLL